MLWGFKALQPGRSFDNVSFQPCPLSLHGQVMVLLRLLKRDQVLRLLARLLVGMSSTMTVTNPDACDIVQWTLRVKMSECNMFSIFYMFNSLRNSNKNTI